MVGGDETHSRADRGHTTIGNWFSVVTLFRHSWLGIVLHRSGAVYCVVVRPSPSSSGDRPAFLRRYRETPSSNRAMSPIITLLLLSFLINFSDALSCDKTRIPTYINNLLTTVRLVNTSLVSRQIATDFHSVKPPCVAFTYGSTSTISSWFFGANPGCRLPSGCALQGRGSFTSSWYSEEVDYCFGLAVSESCHVGCSYPADGSELCSICGVKLDRMAFYDSFLVPAPKDADLHREVYSFLTNNIFHYDNRTLRILSHNCLPYHLVLHAPARRGFYPMFSSSHSAGCVTVDGGAFGTCDVVEYEGDMKSFLTAYAHGVCRSFALDFDYKDYECAHLSHYAPSVRQVVCYSVHMNLVQPLLSDITNITHCVYPIGSATAPLAVVYLADAVSAAMKSIANIITSGIVSSIGTIFGDLALQLLESVLYALTYYKPLLLSFLFGLLLQYKFHDTFLTVVVAGLAGLIFHSMI